jgi:hypothetical protein
MASPLVVNDICKVTFDIVGLNGQTALPSVYYRVTNIAGAPSDQDLANSLDLLITPNLLPVLNALATYRNVIVQKIAPLPIFMRVFSAASTGPGTGGPVPCPQQVSPLISWVTGVPGRAGEGRFYSPFPPTSGINTLTGQVNPIFRASLAALGASLVTFTNFGVVPNTGNVQMVLFHRATLTGTPITNLVARTKWATQKRRGDYGRVNAPPI